MGTARAELAGTGTQTAALCMMGNVYPALNDTESWNGTNWTTVANSNVGRYGPGGAGISTAALAFGGDEDPSPPSNATEEFNAGPVTVTFDVS